MDKLKNLNRIADEMMSDITPNYDSFQKIMQGEPKKNKNIFLFKVAPAVLSLALVIFTGVKLLGTKTPEPKIEFASAGESSVMQLAAVPRGSVVLSQKSNAAANGVWDRGNVKPFPMLIVNGDVYRLLKSPLQLSQDLLGGSLGTVSKKAEDLSNEDINSGILSNIADEGAEVYSVSSMSGAAVAANIGGNMRVFQRSSFQGNAARGESLISTLGSSPVVAMQLSKVGTVTDGADLSELTSLLSGASYKGSATGSGNQTLLIEFENGLVLQLGVKDSTLYGAGNFSAEGFIEAFERLAVK